MSVIGSSSGNYAQPVTVNGFVCKNCTDVDYAKKHIDPAHPKSGPYNINADTDPSRTQAVTFGGSLSGTAATSSVATTDTGPTTTTGRTLDIKI